MTRYSSNLNKWLHYWCHRNVKAHRSIFRWAKFSLYLYHRCANLICNWRYISKWVTITHYYHKTPVILTSVVGMINWWYFHTKKRVGNVRQCSQMYILNHFLYSKSCFVITHYKFHQKNACSISLRNVEAYIFTIQ